MNTEITHCFTPRSGKHSNVKGKGVISFGQQMVMRQIKEMFDKYFFLHSDRRAVVLVNNHSQLKNKVCQEIKKEYSLHLGTDVDVSHIEALWDLGYLPIEVKSLPEGTFVPYGVPVLTIKNTLPEFFWITNFLETLISNMLWMPMTSATTAKAYKDILVEAALKTDKDNIGFVEFQGHDFSQRGHASLGSSLSSGLGHLTSFSGSDTLPTIYGARKYYDEEGFVSGSVKATEHSIQCAYKSDKDYINALVKNNPNGIMSVVMDGYNLWEAIEHLRDIKDDILARDGKYVCRPDSGDPVDILCGHNTKDLYFDDSPESKGVIELLWDIFGGTINEQGYKVLDPHIGAIYGDSITLERAQEICDRLEAKGFAATNIVLGIGSYTYQMVTRDTHGLAMKATYCEVLCGSCDGKGSINSSSCPTCMGKTEGREIFKDPITDDGTKKSAKGLLRVDLVDGQYKLTDQVSWKEESGGELVTIFKNGELLNQVTLTEIKNRV